MTRRISIIIPTYNRHDSLFKALKSIEENRLSDSEVIVVDQSPDSSVKSEVFKQLFSFISYITAKKPNLPAARNKGFLQSKGDIIFFMDDDTLMQSGCLQEHLSSHRLDNIGCVSGRTRLPKQMADTCNGGIVAELDPQTGLARGNFDSDYEGDVQYATGAHFSVKRTAYEAVGGFNPAFKGNAMYEDVDFSLRLRKKGFKIIYNPRAVILHMLLDYGGCHDTKSAGYYIQRLYNHTLYYLMHLRPFPSPAYFRFIKNLSEFASRNGHGGHDPVILMRCAVAILSAYKNAIASRVFWNHLIIR